jgi:hypothetical protein
MSDSAKGQATMTRLGEQARESAEIDATPEAERGPTAGRR